MAAGEVKLQSSDLRIATVTFEDGAAGNVSVVVPKEGGELLTSNTTHTHISADITDLSTTISSAITAQKASATVYGTAKISVSGSTLTITTV